MKEYIKEEAVLYFKSKLTYSISCTELKILMDEGSNEINIIDVRSSEAFKEGHIEGATLVDPDVLDSQWNKFKKDKLNIVYCYGLLCHRGYRVCLEAAKKGFRVADLLGNYHGWFNYPYPIVK